MGKKNQSHIKFIQILSALPLTPTLMVGPEAEGDYFNLGHMEESGKTNLTLVCEAWGLGLLFTSLWLRLCSLPCSPQVHR